MTFEEVLSHMRDHVRPAAATERDRVPERPEPSAAHTRRTIQARLTVGPSDDPLEREADEVAASVMDRLDGPSVELPAATGNGRIRAGDTESEPVRRAPIARIGAAGGDVDADTDAAIRSSIGGGRPLEASVRGRMEQGFGADFSGVRVHAGREADSLNRRLQARAFTTGSDIFFARGQYDPSSRSGQELLAHELTHVVQQGGARIAPSSAPTG